MMIACTVAYVLQPCDGQPALVAGSYKSTTVCNGYCVHNSVAATTFIIVSLLVTVAIALLLVTAIATLLWHLLVVASINWMSKVMVPSGSATDAWAQSHVAMTVGIIS